MIRGLFSSQLAWSGRGNRPLARCGRVRENNTLLLLLLLGLIGVLWLPAECLAVPAASAAAVFKPYRFDDEFRSAVVSEATVATPALTAADPIIWHNFLSQNDVTWIALRGRIGFRQGDLIPKAPLRSSWRPSSL